MSINLRVLKLTLKIRIRIINMCCALVKYYKVLHLACGYPIFLILSGVEKVNLINFSDNDEKYKPR